MRVFIAKKEIYKVPTWKIDILKVPSDILSMIPEDSARF